MATFNLTVRLQMLKEIGITVQYSEHVQEEAAKNEAANNEAAMDSEEEFPAVVPPKPEEHAPVHDAGHDAWNSAAHTSTAAQEQQKPSGMDDSSAVMQLDYSKFVVGEPADESISFCSWKVIEAYPDQFIGKTNRPRAKPFFDKILEGKVWDFFYLYNPEKPSEKPRVLVPTVQLEGFLKGINRALGTSLAIPGGANQDRFYMRFGQGDTPRPRYLQRCRDQKSLKVDSFPDFQQEDYDNFRNAHDAIQEDWMKNWQMLVPRPSFDKKKNSDKKAAKRRLERERMLHSTQEYLYLAGSGKRADVVLVCVDVEAIEMPPNPISEIGIAILDVKDLGGVEPGPGGQNWWQLIQAHHLRTKEYSGLVNHRFVHGYPGSFDFGTSTFPQERELPEAIMAILEPYISKNRHVVFVAHDAGSDMKYLASIGFDVLGLPGLVDELDTKEIHLAWKASDQGKSLVSVLNDLCIHSKHLHNAGNDAVYTLRALLGVAIEQIRERDAKAKGEEYKPALFDVKQETVVEDPNSSW